jgi:hypothetical protein
MAARLPLDRDVGAWDRRLVPALTLRPAPLPWVAALRALPAVVVVVVGGAWLALAVGVAFGVDLGSGAAAWIGLAGACACVSGVMIGAGGNTLGAAALAIAALAAVGLAVGTDTDSNPVRPAFAPRADVAPPPRGEPRADVPPPPRGEPRAERPSRPAGDARSGAAAESPAGEAPAAAAAAPRTVGAPAKLVRSYYAAIDSGDFAAAWARLSPAVQARFGGFAVWRDGYETTLSQRVEGVEVDGAQIRYVLVARDRTPCGGSVEQRFAVVWTMADGHASSLHAVRLAGQDPATAC